MPTYDYVCAACSHELELFQKISEAPKKKCPACKKNRLKRQIGGGAGFLFKGSGFYLTDYRSDSYKQAADADSKPAEAKPAAPKPADKTSEPAGSKPASKEKTGAPDSAPPRKAKKEK